MSKVVPHPADANVLVMIEDNKTGGKDVRLQLTTLNGEWSNSFTFDHAAARRLGEALVKAAELASSKLFLAPGYKTLDAHGTATPPLAMPSKPAEPKDGN